MWVSRNIRNLVIARCGRGSIPTKWVPPHDRNWHLFLLPYQFLQPEERKNCDFYALYEEGLKWAACYRFFLSNDLWKQYDYIWLVDDDIEIDLKDINLLFYLCEGFNATIAQPSLTRDSYFSHPITLHDPMSVARRTSFVEIMMPCFRRDVLEFLLPTIRDAVVGKTGEGLGLDWIWPPVLDHKGIYIFDCIQARHTRPVRGKSQKSNDEAGDILHTYGVQPRMVIYSVYRKIPFEYYPFGKILSTGCKTSQSSIIDRSIGKTPEEDSQRAINGNHDQVAGFHTDLEENAWWKIDLGANYVVECIKIYNRYDDEYCARRLFPFCIEFSDDNLEWNVIYTYEEIRDDILLFESGSIITVLFRGFITTRHVRIRLLGKNYLHLRQVEVYGAETQ